MRTDFLANVGDLLVQFLFGGGPFFFPWKENNEQKSALKSAPTVKWVFGVSEPKSRSRGSAERIWSEFILPVWRILGILPANFSALPCPSFPWFLGFIKDKP